MMRGRQCERQCRAELSRSPLWMRFKTHPLYARKLRDASGRLGTVGNALQAIPVILRRAKDRHRLRDGIETGSMQLPALCVVEILVAADQAL